MVNKYMAAGIAAATLLGAAGTAQAGKDLDAIKARGQLICGVNTVSRASPRPTARASGSVSTSTSAGPWRPPSSVIPRRSIRADDRQQRFTALQSGEVDILARNTTVTLTRDTALASISPPSTTMTGRVSW